MLSNLFTMAAVAIPLVILMVIAKIVNIHIVKVITYTAQEWSLASYYYRPQTKLREGNVFIPVRQSFLFTEGQGESASGSGGSASGSGGVHPPGYTSPSIPPGTYTSPGHLPLDTHPLDTPGQPLP